MEFDIFPVGSTVRLNSALSKVEICQIIGIRLDKRRGEVFYVLGYVTPRRWPLSWLPKKESLDHMVRGDSLELISLPASRESR